MGQKDPRVDAYVSRAAPFARPILAQLRTVVHAAVPDATEAIKWGMPFFEHHGILCSMAAFKSHAAFTIRGGDAILGGAAKDGAMGQFGRITALADLPPRARLSRLLREAARRNASGVKAPRPVRKARPEAVVPPDLARALRGNARARATFEAFPPGKRRDYVEWIVEARAAETRARRLGQAVAWMAEGKGRNWKYERC